MRSTTGVFLRGIAASCFLLLLGGCAALKPAGSQKTSSMSYDEDLSGVRPKYNVDEIDVYQPKILTEEPAKTTPEVAETTKPVILQVNREVNKLLDSSAVKSKAVKYTDGYRIQVYVGNNRSDLENAKAFCYHLQPGIGTYITFNQPTYRLKVGDFLTKDMADKYLAMFKPSYPTAFITRDKIEIKKAISTK